MEQNPAAGQTQEMEGDVEKSTLEDPAKQERVLRLVLLGWAGTGKSSVGNAILGCSAFQTRGSTMENPVTVNCEKICASVAGRQVAMVDTPDWFHSESRPEEVQNQLALCKSLSAPGPHAFLLCVPVHHTGGFDLQSLDALEQVFGPEAISKHCVVLFTFTDQLPEGVNVEKHLNSERKDLLEVLERCGGRSHVISSKVVSEEVGQSVLELFGIVEDIVREGGHEYYTFPSLLCMEENVSEKEEAGNSGGIEELSSQMLRQRRDEEEEDLCIKKEGAEKREDSGDDVLDEDLDLSPPAPPPPFLRWLWDTVVDWVLWLPSLVRGSTLMGSFVGLFFGGAMGATVSSVATEVGRRKHKPKTK